MKIVVIGGTGLIGTKVVNILQQNGHQALAATPATGVDTISGKGLSEALEGAEVVVDVSNSPSFESDAAMAFFKTAGENISAAEANAGVKHHVALSVVGTQRLQDSGYFRAKLAQESKIKASAIPYTLVRATQFFEFIRGIAQSGTSGDTVRLSHAPFQPMAAQDVAAAVACAALGAPVNGTLEVAGPEILRLDEVIAKVLDADRDPRKVVTDSEAPYFGVRLNNPSLLPDGEARYGATTFGWWLVNVRRLPKDRLAKPVGAERWDPMGVC
ncbi:SDR family oxidoreductase [Sinorhizobium numidicum]|uniref:SDR family oxidoreductase n=1 Tax=Sinorhizobium numidicum TaxID=680248 RepID=A0ABY8CPU7_9HYPH|nr:SDR family oxidoreductase [Sinorhizobium numidicum]WEX74682.1 SDR family oxidoreductase [Sinorhizobium numidicum]WEX80674.1 SDR family oxidoreductase [Sinorhizobium numidicum]